MSKQYRNKAISKTRPRKLGSSSRIVDAKTRVIMRKVKQQHFKPSCFSFHTTHPIHCHSFTKRYAPSMLRFIGI